jgi:hypothetical protein
MLVASPGVVQGKATRLRLGNLDDLVPHDGSTDAGCC